MIKDFCNAWEKGKDRLKEYISTHEQREYYDYLSLVKILFRECINQYVEKTFDSEKITQIDDGDYQGTLIFVIPLDTYQPGVGDYVFTSVYYGSCSGCDTLLGINNYEYGIPNEEQVSDYMELLLHLLQNCHWLISKLEEE